MANIEQTTVKCQTEERNQGWNRCMCRNEDKLVSDNGDSIVCLLVSLWPCDGRPCLWTSVLGAQTQTPIVVLMGYPLNGIIFNTLYRLFHSASIVWEIVVLFERSQHEPDIKLEPNVDADIIPSKCLYCHHSDKKRYFFCKQSIFCIALTANSENRNVCFICQWSNDLHHKRSKHYVFNILRTFMKNLWLVPWTMSYKWN